MREIGSYMKSNIIVAILLLGSFPLFKALFGFPYYMHASWMLLIGLLYLFLWYNFKVNEVSNKIAHLVLFPIYITILGAVAYHHSDEKYLRSCEEDNARRRKKLELIDTEIRNLGEIAITGSKDNQLLTDLSKNIDTRISMLKKRRSELDSMVRATNLEIIELTRNIKENSDNKGN